PAGVGVRGHLLTRLDQVSPNGYEILGGTPGQPLDFDRAGLGGIGSLPQLAIVEEVLLRQVERVCTGVLVGHACVAPLRFGLLLDLPARRSGMLSSINSSSSSSGSSMPSIRMPPCRLPLTACTPRCAAAVSGFSSRPLASSGWYKSSPRSRRSA